MSLNFLLAHCQVLLFLPLYSIRRQVYVSYNYCGFNLNEKTEIYGDIKIEKRCTGQ